MGFKVSLQGSKNSIINTTKYLSTKTAYAVKK